MPTATRHIPNPVRNNHLETVDLGLRVIDVPKKLSRASFEDEYERGTFDEHVYEYFGEYFPERAGGNLRMCKLLSGEKNFMDLCRMLLGFSEDTGTIDELSGGMQKAELNFALAQVEDLLHRFDKGEKAIGFNEAGGLNLFVLDNGRVMDILYIRWNGRTWKVGNDPWLLVNQIPKGTRLFLRN